MAYMFHILPPCYMNLSNVVHVQKNTFEYHKVPFLLVPHDDITWGPHNIAKNSICPISKIIWLCKHNTLLMMVQVLAYVKFKTS